QRDLAPLAGPAGRARPVRAGCALVGGHPVHPAVPGGDLWRFQLGAQGAAPARSSGIHTGQSGLAGRHHLQGRSAMNAKSILFKALRMVRQGWAWSLILVLGLAVIVWTLGPALAINDHKPWGSAGARWLTISALLLGWGLSLVFANWKKQRRLKTEESDSEAQERLRRENLIVEEQLELHSRYKQALRTLSRSSLYKGRSERWRRELPWYLLLGPEGSGKTSLLEFSGLDFPLNTRDQQGVTNEVAG